MQVFIHRHYDAIKLALIVLIFILTFIAVIGQIQKSAQDADERADAVKSVLDEYQSNTARLLENEREKTDEIIQNQQEQTRIMCILFRTGTSASALTAEERQLISKRCDEEIRGFEDPQSNQETTEQPQQTPEPQARQKQNQTGGEGGSSSNSTPTARSNPQDTSQAPSDPEPEPSIMRQLTDDIRSWINSLL